MYICMYVFIKHGLSTRSHRELSFKKGDIIYIRRAIDKNWFEGEHNAMIGLFPANYVEVSNSFVDWLNILVVSVAFVMNV